MKYLKLILEGDVLPAGRHVTFAYFGKTPVNPERLREILGDVRTFKLNYERGDKYGPMSDIPVSVFSADDTSPHTARTKIIDAFGVGEQNFRVWSPHISNPEFDAIPTELTVIGVESNDGRFRVMFPEAFDV